MWVQAIPFLHSLLSSLRGPAATLVIQVSQMRRSNSQCLSDLPNYSTASLLTGQPYPKCNALNITMETEPCDICPGFLKVHTCSRSKVPENVGKSASAAAMRPTPRLGEVRMHHKSATRYVISGVVRTRPRPQPGAEEEGEGPERSGLALHPTFCQWKLCHEDPFLGLGPTPYGLAVSIPPLESPRVKLNESRNWPPSCGLSAAEEIGKVIG